MEPKLTPLAELGARVARAQDRSLSQIAPRTKERLLGVAPVRRSRWIVPALAAAIAVAGALLWWRLGTDEPRVELSTGGTAAIGQWVGAPSDAPLLMRFEDGTTVTLAPGANARVATVGPEGARIVVEQGVVDVAVVPLEGARWLFDVGPFAVRVTGTRFRIRWDPDSTDLSVELEEGSVMVSGPVVGDERRIAAGETLEVSVAKATMVLTTASSTEAAEPTTPAAPTLAHSGLTSPPTPSAGAIATSAPSVEPQAPSEPAPNDPWVALAKKGKYAEALDQARGAGYEQILEAATADELALLADVARYAGDRARATQALTTLRRRFPGGARAATAAFMLGRIAFDEQKAYPRAAEWFSTYLAEAPSGAFSREALGRLLEAHDLAGNTKAAKTAARAYLAAYPSGPHAAQARKVLGP